MLAFEKVTLHGLTLVPRRRCITARLEPRLSREIFIHHALVLGEFQSDAPYFRHNRELVREVQTLEAKARRRDILVDARARFTFYDARIPQRIYTADEFEKWRRVAEKRNPSLLFMCRRDLMLHPAWASPRNCTRIRSIVGGTIFPLEYRFEPGDRADGITVTVPLAAVNQLPLEPFDWLVPGFRLTFVCADPHIAQGTAREIRPSAGARDPGSTAELKPSDRPSSRALRTLLGKVSGRNGSPGDFQPETLPEYLRMNFRDRGSGGSEVASGRDLG